MAIDSQNLANDIRFALDAEGADHYDDVRDIIPAINLSVKWLVNVVNKTMGQRKFGEEIFRDLSEITVFNISSDNRIQLGDIWTILAVYPNPKTGNNGVGEYHISSKESSKRLTIEEWSYNINNPFEAGNMVSKCLDLNQSAYLAPFTYGNSGFDKEIEIRPRPTTGKVSVAYVKNPTDISVLGVQDVQFPNSVYNLILNKALSYISYKQGDGTNLISVSESDIRTLTNSIL